MFAVSVQLCVTAVVSLTGSTVAVMSAHCLTFSDNQSFVHMSIEG